MTNKLAIVVSRFNHHITEKLLAGAYQHLLKAGIANHNITITYVPGAVEIPLTAQLLAKQNTYDAIICLGCVIRGETDHYQYVCQQVSHGCQEVMLKHEIPVIFGVLTTDNDEQALARVGGSEGHKGVEAADAALTMINLVKQIIN